MDIKLKGLQRYALRMESKKWNNICFHGAVDQVISDSKCCELFFEELCKKCYIAEGIENIACIGTPYDAWCAHQKKEHPDKKVDKVYCDECKNIALNQLKLMINLWRKLDEEIYEYFGRK